MNRWNRCRRYSMARTTRRLSNILDRLLVQFQAALASHDVERLCALRYRSEVVRLLGHKYFLRRSYLNAVIAAVLLTLAITSQVLTSCSRSHENVPTPPPDRHAPAVESTAGR